MMASIAGWYNQKVKTHFDLLVGEARDEMRPCWLEISSCPGTNSSSTLSHSRPRGVAPGRYSIEIGRGRQFRRHLSLFNFERRDLESLGCCFQGGKHIGRRRLEIERVSIEGSIDVVEPDNK
jgi:hypothetical protein